MDMQTETVQVWWDEEGDFLYVSLAEGDGDMVHTQDGKAMVKVDDAGNVLGFQIFGVSKQGRRQKPFGFELVPETGVEVA